MTFDPYQRFETIEAEYDDRFLVQTIQLPHAKCLIL